MQVSLFQLADYANTTADGKLNVMGIFRILRAQSFPVRHSSMVVVIKLSPELGEYGQSRTLTIKLVDPDGKEIISLSGPLNIPEPKGGLPPEVNAILEIKDLIFPHPGPYQFVLMLDKDHKGSISLQVEQLVIPDAGEQAQ